MVNPNAIGICGIGGANDLDIADAVLQRDNRRRGADHRPRRLNRGCGLAVFHEDHDGVADAGVRRLGASREVATLRDAPSRCTISPSRRIASTCSRQTSKAQTSASVSARCDANRLPIAPVPTIAMRMAALSIGQEIRQIEDRLRHVGDDEERKAQAPAGTARPPW